MDAVPSFWLQKIIQKVYDFLFAGLIFRRAAKIVSVGSDFITNSKLRRIMENKTVEIENGVDTKQFIKKDVNSSDLLKYKNKKVFAFVGNLMSIKRLELLIEAMSRINRQDIVLLVVGDGYEEKKYKDKVKDLGLQEKVIFLGQKSGSDLVAVYNRATCTVIPSEFESFSLVALESMSCSTPVIMSNVQGARKRVEDGLDGFLFNSNDVDDLISKMKVIIGMNNQEIDKMGEWGRQKVQKKYDWDNHVAKLCTVYDNVLAL